MPTASNGSVAPLAPDPAAQLRTIRALRDEAFDVVHLHEPLRPGTDHDGAAVPQRADRRHVPPCRATAPPTPSLKPGVRWLAKPARPALRGVEGRPGDRPARPSAVSYELLFNGIEVERFAKATPTPTAGPTIFFVGRHEERKGLAVLLDALRLPAARRARLGRRHRAPDRGAAGPRTAATPASSGWAG